MVLCSRYSDENKVTENRLYCKDTFLKISPMCNEMLISFILRGFHGFFSPPCECDNSWTQKTHSHRKWHHQGQKPRRRFEHDTDCRADWKYPVMDGQAVLLPQAALVNPAGVSERPLISHRGPGEPAQISSDKAHVAPPAVLCGHIDDAVGVGGAHHAVVLPVFTVRAGDLVGEWKLTVHPDVSLQVS